MITARAFAGRRYALLGLARSGLATLDALLASGADVLAWDAREEARAQMPPGAMAGDPLVADLGGYDGIIVSPGVPINRHPIADVARHHGVPLIGDIELFAQARAELPPHKVVGITGTNGKSTTTALIHHIIKSAGMPTLMGGNIGLPILAQDPLPAGGVYVLELSSFQIDLTYSLDCDIAVLTNITPDHLDRYPSFEAYAAAKARLFAMQSSDHAGVIGTDDQPAMDVFAALWMQRKSPSDTLHQVNAASGPPEAQSFWPSLQGPHNAQNAMLAIHVCAALGLDAPTIEAALRSYPGLPHRMERVAEVNGVLFVNDSKATNATSTAPALAAYPAIHWIAGGQAKTEELEACAPHFGHVKAAYLIGEAQELFAGLLAPHMPVHRCGTMADATRLAFSAAQPGEVILLSPACASFDQFRDYEDRGDQFRALARALGEGDSA